jgi:molybdopterin/thiamine biosynthesis adenylyltransferase
VNDGNDRFSRQSFLGEDAERIIRRAVVGVAGLGGGGSHIVQQLAHIGFQNYVLYDGDRIEDSNLNRLVGGTAEDVVASSRKIDIAERTIRRVWPDAKIQKHACRWQDQPESVRGCDLIFGSVDGFQERGELEACARRYVIPLIDIGMDVHPAQNGEAPRMAGQVLVSTPGGPCMRCLRFITDEALSREAARYGAAGARPQVVWPNGVLASTAIGIGMDLLTDWTRSLRAAVYLSYDGNAGTVAPHPLLKYVANTRCPHYPVDAVGDPIYRRL